MRLAQGILDPIYSLFGFIEQIFYFNIQAFCNFTDVDERYIFFGSFYHSYVCSVKFGSERQFFLRNLQTLSDFTHGVSKLNEGVFFCAHC